MSNLRHGHSRNTAQTPTYRSWKHMVGRCTRPSDQDYPRYGGRGIKVCDRWMSFENFLADMGVVPKGMTLDRVDNNGDYEPGNCRWASRKEQAQNYSRNIHIEIDGVTRCLKDWASIYKLPYTAVHQRVRILGWSPTKALMTPLRGAE